MKIPSDYFAYLNGDLVQKWREKAIDIGMETGICVVVHCDFVNPKDPDDERVSRVYFKVLDHEFESLNDLKRAIANKAFL